MLKEAGLLFLVLLAVVILGQMWFHFVDGILERWKKRLFPPKEPMVWHLLPKEEGKTEEKE